MSKPLGAYTFLPWIRQGIANQIGAAPSTQRATIPVTLTVEGAKIGGGTETASVPRNVELYGPGDVIGIDAAQISRREPENWVTNFEPNYLAAIEFYDEDFPWRYTPAAPAGRRLLPWLALIVLEEEGEFKEGTSTSKRPLPYIEITTALENVFYTAADGWAWAHAHFNAEFSANVVETDAALAARKAEALIASQPDRACSRLLCPRKLKEKTGYHAFLVPAFESGRMAGLGINQAPLFADPANGLSALSSAWGPYATPANRPEPTSFPFYHRWYFRTAEEGDFESLVRLLKPRAVDSRVGYRDIDVSDPSPNIAGIPELGGVLRMGGALRAPLVNFTAAEKTEFDKFEDWAKTYPHAFQSQLAAFVNLADSYQVSGPGADGTADPDPMVTPPLYGRWPALTERLLDEANGSPVPHRANWVHDLNLDPRYRSAAGFGTAVIQKDQEQLMEGAWNQIGDVLEANRRIRLAHFARHAGVQDASAPCEGHGRRLARRIADDAGPRRRPAGVGGRHRPPSLPPESDECGDGVRRHAPRHAPRRQACQAPRPDGPARRRQRPHPCQ